MNTDFAELKQCIEDTPDPKHKEISKAMAVLVTALSVGPNPARLTEESWYPNAFVDVVAMLMKEAVLWKNNTVDDREWCDEQGEINGVRLYAHALVALGFVKRCKTLTGYLYVNAATGKPVGEWNDGDELC